MTEKIKKNKVGRPSKYTQELADEICANLSEGQSLRKVCEPEHMPSKTTIFAWFRTNKEFLNQYERAKQESADAMAEEILDIADDGTNDWMERRDKDGAVTGLMLNTEHVQRSRLRIDTRKFLMAKMKPKKYGEKILHEGEIGFNKTLTMDEATKLSIAELKQIANASN